MSRVIGILLALLVAFAPPATRATSMQSPDSKAPVILVFGDSLSAGYGIRVEQGWVNLLAQKIEHEGYGFRVVNASVTGETTAGGLARLPHALLRHQPRLVILELGGNDGLRSLPLAGTRDNLDRMIAMLRSHGVSVLLLGMRMPPNYGERYTSAFQMMYEQLAQVHQVALVPFLLDRVALHPELMQADGIHPNERGQPLLLENVWPTLQPLLRAAAGTGKARSG